MKSLRSAAFPVGVALLLGVLASFSFSPILAVILWDCFAALLVLNFAVFPRPETPEEIWHYGARRPSSRRSPLRFQ